MASHQPLTEQQAQAWSVMLNIGGLITALLIFLPVVITFEYRDRLADATLASPIAWTLGGWILACWVPGILLALMIEDRSRALTPIKDGSLKGLVDAVEDDAEDRARLASWVENGATLRNRDASHLRRLADRRAAATREQRHKALLKARDTSARERLLSSNGRRNKAALGAPEEHENLPR